MSAWMISEIVRVGGTDQGNDGEEEQGHFRAEYRGYYLWFVERDEKLHVARVDDFDRWANSRVYEGKPAYTIEELNELLTLLDEIQTSILKRHVTFFRPPSSIEEAKQWLFDNDVRCERKNVQ